MGRGVAACDGGLGFWEWWGWGVAVAGEFGEQGLEAGVVGGNTEVKVEAGRVGGERGEGGEVGLELLLEAGAASGGAAGGDGGGLSGGGEGLEDLEGGGGFGGGGSVAGCGRGIRIVGGEVGGAVAMGVEEGVESVGATRGELPVDGAVMVGAGMVSEELFGKVASDSDRGGFVVGAVELVGDEVEVGGEVGGVEIGREEGFEIGEEVGDGLEGWAGWERRGAGDSKRPRAQPTT